MVNLFNLISIRDHRMDHKILRDLLSLNKIMIWGRKRKTKTHLKKILLVALTVVLFVNGSKVAILANQLTTTTTQLQPCLEEGNTNI